MKKLLVLVAVLAFVGAVQGANALLNAGFEDGMNNWTAWQWGSSVAPAITTADKYEGAASLECSNAGLRWVWDGGSGAFQGVNVGENQAVSMSGYIKGTYVGGFVGIDMVFFDVAPTPESMDPPSIGRVELPFASFGAPDINGWMFGSFSAVTPALTSYMKFEFSNNGNTSPILFDNVTGTIPEPVSLVLLGLGGLFLRRRSK